MPLTPDATLSSCAAVTALVSCLLAIFVTSAQAQPAGFNYDESKVPSYELPDPLVLADGQPVRDAEMWRNRRRPEILGLFEEHVYGRSPGRPDSLRFRLLSKDDKALGGKAVRKRIAIDFTADESGPSMEMLLYLTRNAASPPPVFLGLNFSGNHSIHTDPSLPLSARWMRDKPDEGVVDHRATERSRGVKASRWPVETMVDRGYALATIYYGDIDPDFDDGFRNGVHPLSLKPGQTQPGPGEWGSIAAWAWGLSRALDYLETDDDVDPSQVALMGHSRLGKTALWAGALDERFAIVISNNSGCGGAALSRRRFGETVKRINTVFPHWFADNFNRYNGDEDALPVDQHMLIALIAPRPVYIAGAEGDRWADPRGEFLSAKHADPVYRLLGKAGLGVGRMPSVDHPVGDTIGYHIRRGNHDVTGYDWRQYLDFADRHFGSE